MNTAHRVCWTIFLCGVGFLGLAFLTGVTAFGLGLLGVMPFGPPPAIVVAFLIFATWGIVVGGFGIHLTF